MSAVAQTPTADSSEAEIQALEKLCERLQGFGVDTPVEWVDGFLTGLATLPSLPPVESWLATLSNDQFDRVFADPQDRDQALQVLTTRLQVVREQLNPQRLIDPEGELHLLPLIDVWDDTRHPGWQNDEELRAARAEVMATMGAEWARGCVIAITTQAQQGAPSSGANPAAASRWDQLKSELLAHVAVLIFDAEDDLFRSHLAEHHATNKAGIGPSRDVLVDAALLAVQSLRMQWLEHELKPATRQVAPTPGRNDPCHCGSGKKFKKCHGA